MAGSKWQDQVSPVGGCGDGSDLEGGSVERETGIIEKLLNTYGFIRCCDRQARLFFHYSQFNGNVEHLKMGDAVDFEMTYDKKSGKPIAVSVAKICNDPMMGMGQQLVSGTVTAELNAEGREGRVAYENCGECFFIVFTRDALVDKNDKPRQGQTVQFYITTDAAGNLQASQVRCVGGGPPAPPQGFPFSPQPHPPAVMFSHGPSVMVPHNMIAPMMPGMGVPVVGGVVGYPPQVVMTPLINGHPMRPLNPKEWVKEQEMPSATIQQSVNSQQAQQQTQHFSGQQTNNQNGASAGPQAAAASPQKGRKARKTQQDTEEDNPNQNNARNSRYQGVVCTLKDSFGFVERSDVVKEIFFHYSEGYDGISLGDDVSFDIAMRNNREVAVGLHKLPPGTVVFEDIDPAVRKGNIAKLPNTTDQPLDGKVSFTEDNGKKREIAFGDRDLIPAPFTLKLGDPVEFQFATDRRDGLERATNMCLATTDKTCFQKETRLQGTVVAVKDNYGFVASDQGGEYYFKLAEVIDQDPPRIDAVVQFTLGTEAAHQNNGSPRQVAIRLTRVHSAQSSGKRKSRKNNNPPRYTHKGYVVALKEQFGFIEADSRQEDIFFHFSNFDGNAADLQLGAEVEFGLAVKNHRQSADCVRSLEAGTIPPIKMVSDEILTGKVLRSLRCFNPDQEPYCGLVSKVEPTEGDPSEEEENGLDTNANKKAEEYEFSVMSLAKKGEVLHKGDAVEYQLAICQVTDKVMAINVRAIRDRKTATVEAVKGQYGFLNFEVESGKKLFFHMTEVKSLTTVQPGDSVEFDVVRSGRGSKFSAMNVKLVKAAEAGPRPAALVSRLKAMAVDESGPKVIAIRQPRGPDGTRGFQLSIAA